MTTRTINGKTYYEYTPQELEELRTKRIADYYERHGQQKFAVSPFTQTNGKIYKHKSYIPL